MIQECFELQSEEDTKLFGAFLAAYLTSGLVVGLQGEIGAGKTCMVRACLQALGIQSSIKSPTFTLVESYALANFDIHHFDLYRLNSIYELEDLGFRDYMSSQSICFIEWPEKAPFIIPFIDFMIEFKLQLPGRNMCLNAQSKKGEALLKLCQRKKWLG
jgi:tRNA threonylcarbamoyladenosine biosynthesis protein TsaE